MWSIRQLAADAPPRALLLAAIVLVLPLEVSKVLFPIQQIEISRLLMVVAIGWELCRLLHGARPLPGFLTLAVGLNVVVIVASFLVTRWSDGVLEVLAVLFYAAFLVFVADAISDARDMLLVAAALIASGVYTSIIALVQWATGFYLWREGSLDVLGRANATFGDPNVFARVLDICIVVGLALLATGGRRGRLATFLTFAALSIIAAGLVQTESRAGWALLAVVLVACLPLAVRSRHVMAGVAVVVLSFAVVTAITPNGVGRAGSVFNNLTGAIDRANHGGLAGDATYRPPRRVPGSEVIRVLPLDGVRVYLLEAGIAMWQDHPIFGVGTGGFGPMMLGPYHGFIPAERLSSDVTVLPHTALGQVTAENGYLGLLALVALILTLWTVAARGVRGAGRYRIPAYALGVAILSIFLASQMEGRLFTEPYLWAAIGMLAATTRLSNATTAPATDRPRIPVVNAAEPA